MARDPARHVFAMSSHEDFVAERALALRNRPPRDDSVTSANERSRPRLGAPAEIQPSEWYPLVKEYRALVFKGF